MNLRILFLEEDIFIASSIKRALVEKDFDVHIEHPKDFDNIATDLEQFHLVIIGEENKEKCLYIIERITELNINSGLVVINEDASKEEMIDYYKAGIDNFVQKPFDIDLFIPSITSLSNRVLQTGLVRFVGDIKIDVTNQVICCEGRQVRLNPLEIKLLVNLLGTNKNKHLLHSDINKILFDTEENVDQNTSKVYMLRLRSKLKEINSTDVLIKNKYGSGYYLQTN